MAKESKSEVQNLIWDIMIIIKKYLDDNKIKYYMLGGTLLGAIRHNGFIPWDDDIDIGVPREQYEYLLKNISKYLPNNLELMTYFDDSDHHYYFARIVDKNHALIRKGSIVEREENVWIDIFPLDGMPNNIFSRYIHMMKLLYARMMYHLSTFEKVNLKRPNRPLHEKIVISFVKVTGLGTKGNPKKWLDDIDKLLKKYSLEKSNYIVNFMGQYKFKEMFLKSWYGNGTLYDFEDDKLMGPNDFDKVLTKQYGEYMTPPKEKDKNAHDAYIKENRRDV